MHAMEDLSRAFEWVAVGVIVLGAVLALSGVGRALARGTPAEQTYRRGREVFGRSILVSLEILVAADLMRTVAVQPTLRNVAVLGAIVLVRTILSLALDVEIDGVLPWRKRELAAAGRSTVAAVEDDAGSRVS